MPRVHSITPCLWFDREAEAAANYYIGIFPNSKISEITYYTEAGQDQHRMPAGTALTVAFDLDGFAFTALNGGPVFKFNEAVSFQIYCDNQQEVDHYWDRLGEGGPPEAQQCGWIKDKFGLSWQIVPVRMMEMLTSSDKAASGRAMEAMMGMKKLDIAALEKAYAGK
jgi:predicted 3-demethylubiquinone-9 3-methyltransferase (glyoxalase superfamily)